jgi:hypothetical protein
VVPIVIKIAKPAGHPDDRLVLFEKRLVFARRSVGNQNGLREVCRIDDDQLRRSGAAKATTNSPVATR